MFTFKRQKKEPSPGVELSSALAKQLIGSDMFDPEYYILRNPDVEDFLEGPLTHYLRHGIEEGREASPYFSARTYIRRHAPAGTNPQSALMYALDRLDDPDQQLLCLPADDISFIYLLERSQLFDVDWYCRRYKDIKSSSLEPLAHFVTTGSRELRDPSDKFDTRFYCREYREYINHFDRPIEYFLRFGFRHRHAIEPLPLYASWLEHFDELTKLDCENIAKECSYIDRPVFGIQIIDIGSTDIISEIIESWRNQILTLSEIRFVITADLSAEQWSQCASLIGKCPGAAVRLPSDALSDLPDGSDVILCGGTVRLRPHASYAFARTLALPAVRAAYSDHDHIDRNRRRSAPEFKPEMSPELMRQVAYAGESIGARLDVDSRSELSQAIASTTTEMTDRCWSRLLLGLRSAEVKRIPYVLFHVAGVAPAISNKLCRSSEVDDVSQSKSARKPDAQTIEIIIPSRDQPEVLAACIHSIESTTDYPVDRYGITVVDNGSIDEAALSYLDDFGRRPRRKVVPCPAPFNFSILCNQGAGSTNADILVFLNNDTTVRDRSWLHRLVEQARQPDVGVVGARLLYPDETVQHGGVVIGVQGVGAHRLVGWSAAVAAAIDLTREMVAVTGACLAIRRDVFQQLGGFEPALQIAFGDLDLCVRSHLAGYRNIYVAEHLLVHYESKSRGLDDTRQKQFRNAREAIYVRSRYQHLFRNDPSYSPNLSLDQIDQLAVPPRSVRPWRRSPPDRKRVLLLSRTHELGHGVATVLQQQARVLRQRGWEVFVGGQPGKREISYPGCRRIALWEGSDAAAFAVEEGIDCIVVHTPPFFSIVRYLGNFPLVYFYDHGEPPPRMFPDFEVRESVDWEKRFCAPMASRVFTISQTIYRAQFRPDAIVLRNGNDHLAQWREEFQERRSRVRKNLGLDSFFVVLQVCRIGQGERYYKGIDRYGALSQDAQHIHPELAGEVRFLIVGKGNQEDVEYCRSLGLTVFANVSDEEMIDLYLACDLYVSLSEWEGYNLGIAQAQALGIDVLSSDIEAHREFGVETSDSTMELCAAIARRHATWNEAYVGRSPVVEPWDVPLNRLAEIVERDREKHAHSVWE